MKKKIISIVLALVTISSFMIMAMGSNSSSSNSGSSSEETTEAIVYEKVDLGTMFDDLSANAYSAKEKYENKYIEVSGYISYISSDGTYINIDCNDDEHWLDSATCKFRSDTDKSFITNLSDDMWVTIKGQVTEAGDIWGDYNILIDTIAY